MFDIATIRRMNRARGGGSRGQVLKADLKDRFPGATIEKVGNNTFRITTSHSVGYVLHGTEVVTILPGGSVMLCSGGWETRTTKDRMNSLQRLGRVYSERGTWYVATAEGRFPYSDNMTIRPNGAVLDAFDNQVYPIPYGSATKAARLGNAITRGIESWGASAGYWESGDERLAEITLTEAVDEAEAMGMPRLDVWDVMDPHVARLESMGWIGSEGLR